MNIIFLMTDSFRFDRMGFLGLKPCHTPNIDRLASQSHVFHNAFFSSFPTIPNRWDIFTGRLNHTYAKWQPLPDSEVVLSQVLGEGGYRTMMIADTPHILQRGFRYQRGFDGFEWIRGQENDHWKTAPAVIDLPCAAEKLRSPTYTLQHYLRNTHSWQNEDDRFVSRTMNAAVTWLEENADQGEFFLYIDTFDPHEPWDATEEYNARYVDPNFSGNRVTYPQYHPASFYTEDEIACMQALYAAEADLVDHQVGKLLDAVDRLGMKDDTAIIFTADHGFCHGEHGIVGKSIVKMGDGPEYFESVPVYDEIGRIPLLIRLPGQTERTDHSGIVQSIDMMPTILELAEVIETQVVHGKSKVQTIQCGFQQEVEWSIDVNRLHGHSLVPMLHGETESVRDFAVCSSALMFQTPRISKAAVITDEWKLCYCGRVMDEDREMTAPTFLPQRQTTDYVVGENRAMLFNLKTDPGEEHNVLEENLDVARELHQRYVEFLIEKETPEDLLAIHREFTIAPT